MLKRGEKWEREKRYSKMHFSNHNGTCAVEAGNFRPAVLAQVSQTQAPQPRSAPWPGPSSESPRE